MRGRGGRVPIGAAGPVDLQAHCVAWEDARKKNGVRTWKTAASEELGRCPSIPMCEYRRLPSSGISPGRVPSTDTGKREESILMTQLGRRHG